MPTSGPLAAMYHHQAYYGPYLYQRAPASPFAASIAAAAAAQHQLPHHHSPAPSQHHYHHHRMHADRFPSHRLGPAPSGPPPSPPGHYAPNALRASASPPANLSCKDGPAPGGSSSRGPPKSAEGPEDEEDDDEEEEEVEDAKGPNSNESQPSTSSGVTSAGGGGGVTSAGSGGVTSAGAQYVSANCVVFTHYSGDVSSVVDEHFSRALSLASSTSTPGGSPSAAAPAAAGSPTEAPGQIDGGMADRDKAPSPMANRNFPPSFWNSNYQLSHGPHLVLPYHPRRHDFYASAPSSSSHSEESPFPSTPSTSSGAAAADPWPSYQPYYHHPQPYHHHHHQGGLPRTHPCITCSRGRRTTDCTTTHPPPHRPPHPHPRLRGRRSRTTDTGRIRRRPTDLRPSAWRPTPKKCPRTSTGSEAPPPPPQARGPKGSTGGHLTAQDGYYR